MADKIPDKLYYSIGEVERITDLKPYVLRFWEKEFSMLKPKKNKKGQRSYKKKGVELILRIKDLLYKQKFTIKGAIQAIKDERKKKGEPEKIDDSRDFLLKVHHELKQLTNVLEGGKSDDLFG